MEAIVSQISAPYATVEMLERSIFDDLLDINGNINFSDFYMARAGMWIKSGDHIMPNPNGHADILFQYDSNGNIEPIER